ncbi:MAG TPA: MMPL family transporter [Mycobacteriales bacterium]|nr:MMPL family transporter [Mycobacteriales bacterium]
MFEAIGRTMYRRRRWVLGLAVAFLAFAGIWGTQVFGKLSGAGFDDPGSQSYRAAQVAADRLGRDGADVVVLYRSDTATVDDPAFQRAVTSTLAALPRSVVDQVTTYWDSREPQLASTDRHASYAVLRLVGDEDQRIDGLAAIEDRLAAPGLDTGVGGDTVINRDINDRVAEDIGRAESLSMPIVMILLVIIFGSLVAASLPLAIGVIAILGAFTALRGLTSVTDVSVFSINVITILGLGLAIDYGLFVVSRFREELRRTQSVEDAVARTMATAGRTVAISGVTVAVSLAGLLIFPQVFLRSMGFGGIAAVLIAMIAALTVLPALLGVFGRRVDSLSVRAGVRRLFRRPERCARVVTAERGAWYRIAHSVMRRPVLYTVGIVAVLIALGLPFLRVTFGGIDARALPAGTESRQVAEAINRDFAPNSTSPIEAVVTLPQPAADPAGQAALNGYLTAVRAVPGVTGARLTGLAGDTARIGIGYATEPISTASRDLVNRIRALPAPAGGTVLVGGQTAELVDLLHSVGSRLPWMGLLVLVATLVLLFLAFGSVVLPVKAVLMNVLSLSASFGALVWIFQDGHLSGLLNFTSTGSVEATQPILVLAIVFGLSMDYEVFLMSRIREEYDRTGDNTAAVATGLQRTGRIITSAALLMVVVVAAFSASGITFIKLIGVAMVLAIVVDATVVRALLVPATMRLLGRANWYAPGPLRRFYARYGLRESDGEAAPVPAQVAA